MLRNLLIMVPSGIVVFEKSWEKHAQDNVNQWGALIRAVHEYAAQSIGFPLSYLETTSAALSIQTDTKTAVICAIIHGNDDSTELGELIAREILRTFLESFPKVDWAKTNSRSQFANFGNKIVDCIKRVADSILENLSSVSGIEACLLVYDDGTESLSKGSLLDKISVIANFRAMLRSTNQLLTAKEDTPNFITMKIGESHLVYVHRVRSQASLVTLVRKMEKAQQLQCYTNICKHQRMINRVFILLSYFSSK